MKVAVCVKHVPEAQALRLDPATKRLDRSGEGTLNGFDANAVEEALRVKDAAGDAEVVLVSLGPERAVDSLRKGLAMGADRAILVSDAAAAGSDLVATSAALAKALEREQPDLVLFGQQAGDSDGAVLWAAVADRLRRPMVSQVAELTVEGGSLRGKRQTEFGYDTIEAPLPAVVAVSDAINEPRYPSLKGIMGARSKPQRSVSLSELGVDAGEVGEAGSKTVVRALNDPPPRGDTVKIEDDGSAAELGGDVAGVVLGSGVRDLAPKAGAYGASKVYVADKPELERPLPQPRVDSLAKLVRDQGFDTVLFASSVLSADVAAGLSARLGAGLNWDLTDLVQENGALIGKRPALGDSVYVDVGWSSEPRLALIRAGTFDP